MKIYLAGKITKHGWRDAILGYRSLADWDPEWVSDGAAPWPVCERAIFGVHAYTGPHFISDDHGCAHADGAHGAAARSDDECPPHGPCFDCLPARPHQHDIRRLCDGAIARSDLVFAWLDAPDAYGTLLELGYAQALGVPTVVAISAARPELPREVWFALAGAAVVLPCVPHDLGARGALATALGIPELGAAVQAWRCTARGGAR